MVHNPATAQKPANSCTADEQLQNPANRDAESDEQGCRNRRAGMQKPANDMQKPTTDCGDGQGRS